MDIFGKIGVPEPLTKFGVGGDPQHGALGSFLALLYRFVIFGAILYTMANLALAGYGFLSAGGDPKKVAEAWSKIWQSLLGLAITAGSVVLAALFGWLIFKDFNAILSPTIPSVLP